MKAVILVFFAIVAATAIAAIFTSRQNVVNPIFNSNNNLKIVGGHVAPPHSLPYQAAIFLNGTLCGGSLITRRHVLTAAHCTKITKSPIVVVGTNRLNKDQPSQKVILHTKVINHPKWNATSHENDISIIELDEDLPLNKYIQTIKLPCDSESFEGAFGQTSGWGMTRDDATHLSPVLLYFNSTVISNQDCQGAFNETDIVLDSMICLDGKDGGPCRGDSGGPLVTISHQKKILIGISSFVSKYGCEEGFPSGFTRVTSFTSWIKRHTGLHLDSSSCRNEKEEDNHL